VIDLEDLPATVRPGQRSAGEPLPKDLPGVLADIERQAIESALDRSGGVQTQAAAALGISERVLRYKMKKYGLEGEQPEQSGGIIVTMTRLDNIHCMPYFVCSQRKLRRPWPSPRLRNTGITAHRRKGGTPWATSI